MTDGLNNISAQEMERLTKIAAMLDADEGTANNALRKLRAALQGKGIKVADFINFVSNKGPTNDHIREETQMSYEDRIFHEIVKGTLCELNLGKYVEGSGRYVGIWEPKDSYGRSLKKAYNLYASTHDVMKTDRSNVVASYPEIQEYLRQETGEFSIPVRTFESQEELIESAYNNPSRLGFWFMPPKDALGLVSVAVWSCIGYGMDYKVAFMDSFVKGTQKGDNWFKGIQSYSYHSMTPAGGNKTFALSFKESAHFKKIGPSVRCSSRLVRAEPRPWDTRVEVR